MEGSAFFKNVSNSKMSQMSEGGGVNPNSDIVTNFSPFFLVTPPLRKLLLVDTDQVDIHIIYIWCRLSLKCITSFHLHYANAFNFNLEHIDFIMCVNPWTLQVCAPGEPAGAHTWRPCRCAHLETLQVRAPGNLAGARTWRPCRCTHLNVNLHWKLKPNVSNTGSQKIKIVQNHFAIAILAISQPFQVPSKPPASFPEILQLALT